MKRNTTITSPQIQQLISQINALKRYLPERVVEKILLNPSSAKVEGEFRLVTVLFADLSGFTHLTEELSKTVSEKGYTVSGKKGAEEITEIVNNYFTKMLNIILNYGGTVDKFMGDAIMVLFGAPVSHEDDPERAVKAALDMQSAMKPFQKLKTSRGVFSLQMSVGINTGLVVAGNVGSEKRMEYTVMGDNVNLASRIEQQASPGEILISKSTCEKVNEIFEIKSLKPVKVKGKSHMIEMYKVLGLARNYPVRLKQLQLQMVGRTRELNSLKQLWEKTLSGNGQVVSVIGDAGIGKTRLIYEFKNQVFSPLPKKQKSQKMEHPAKSMKAITRQELLWLEGKGLSYGTSMLYWTIIEIFKNFFNIIDSDSKEKIKQKIHSKMQSLSGIDKDINKYIPFMYNLFSIKEKNSILDQLDAKTIKQNTFDAVKSCLFAQAKKTPIIIVFEDFHWTDSVSFELLKYISRRIENINIFIVCSYRKSDLPAPDFIKTGGQAGFSITKTLKQGIEKYYKEFALSELSETESETFSKLILKTNHLTIELKRLIIEQSGGNPLYVEELLNSLVENEILKKQFGHWQLSAKISELKIPDSVEGIVMSRLDNLDEKTKDTLQTASVIGKNFQYTILKNIYLTNETSRQGSDRFGSGIKELDNSISVLTERDIIYKESSLSSLPNRTNRQE
ncbi:MAG: adenylate/guanylate cyclase domain-containing protein [bacterium]|nr:adenylate/guanylate cyclase domain-containing protein [bacterium]